MFKIQSKFLMIGLLIWVLPFQCAWGIDPCAAALLLNSELRTDYSRYARSLNESAERKLAEIESRIPHPERNLVICDVGTGAGGLAAALAIRHPHWTVIGVDISPKMITMARESYRIRNLQFKLAEAHDLRLDKQLDVIIYSSILHEVYSFGGDDLRKVTDALRVGVRALKPGGTVVIRDFVAPPNSDRTILFRVAKSEMGRGRSFVDFLAAWKCRPIARCGAELIGASETHLIYKTSLRLALEYGYRYQDSDWGVELAESYFFWDPELAKRLLAEAGFEFERVDYLPSPIRAEGLGRRFQIFESWRIPSLSIPSDKAIWVAHKKKGRD